MCVCVSQVGVYGKCGVVLRRIVVDDWGLWGRFVLVFKDGIKKTHTRAQKYRCLFLFFSLFVILSHRHQLDEETYTGYFIDIFSALSQKLNFT